MSNRPNIAIASCHDKKNYGSQLQAYALQYSVEKLGFNAITIDKTNLNKEIARGRRKYYLENLLNFKMYTAKFGRGIHALRKKTSIGVGKYLRIRDLEYEKYIKEKYHFSPRFDTFQELKEYVRNFNAVIVGSDQNWLPVNIRGNYYTLSFVPDETKRISYATSFGMSQLPPIYHNIIRDFLKDYKSVSVREYSGAKIIKQACNFTPEVVCDPTMLMTANQWEQEMSDMVSEQAEPYIFCYFLGTNIWNRKCAEQIAKNKGLKIVAIPNHDNYVAFDTVYADYAPYNIGPKEFLRLIHDAKYVLTDSFHGTVFSCLFNRQFYCFRRYENAGSQSTNSRLDTLLEELGLSERMCESTSDFLRACNNIINYTSINHNIDCYRKKSMEYLKSALDYKD